MDVDCNISLRNFNSFAVQAYACELVLLEYESQLVDVLEKRHKHKNSLVLGGGSNILFYQNYQGLVVVNRLRGIEICNESEDFATIRVAAGEVWHEFVTWTIKRNYFGLENLSLIPGTVGAAPVQNIGAYGVELEQYFNSLNAIDLNTGDIKVFDKNDCQFTYRDSIFKQLPDRYLITSVIFKLPKRYKPVLNYSGVKEKLIGTGADSNSPSALQVSNAICELRNSKLPLPDKIGNAGSFFKNPTTNSKVYTALLSTYPALPGFKVSQNQYKLSAAWLIDQCGWKGFREGDAGVYEGHALVLVNHGSASGKQIWQMANNIRQSVEDKFGISLETEPRII